MSDTELLVVRDATVHETDIARAWLAVDEDATGASESRFVVLFDTCDQVIRGAAAVRRRCHCTFELVAWAVDTALIDAIAARLVNGVVDGVRRAGAGSRHQWRRSILSGFGSCSWSASRCRTRMLSKQSWTSSAGVQAGTHVVTSRLGGRVRSLRLLESRCAVRDSRADRSDRW